MMFFAASANRPSACAYLMPINDGHVRKGIPMKVAEVKEDKLIDYKYWPTLHICNKNATLKEEKNQETLKT